LRESIILVDVSLAKEFPANFNLVFEVKAVENLNLSFIPVSMLYAMLYEISPEARNEHASITNTLRFLPGDPMTLADIKRPVVREVSVCVEL
jgi:hypothetical protein